MKNLPDCNECKWGRTSLQPAMRGEFSVEWTSCYFYPKMYTFKGHTGCSKFERRMIDPKSGSPLVSNCCGATAKNEIDEIGNICSECGEHCEYEASK